MNCNARLLMLTVLLPVIAVCQNSERMVFDPADSTHGYYLAVPPYTLAVPEAWSVERVPLPYEFAPNIPFKGVDDLRLTPDWGDPQGDGHWTYASCWWLDGDQKLDADVIRKFLIIYLEGLSRWLGGKAAAKVTWSVNPVLKKIKTEAGRKCILGRPA